MTGFTRLDLNSYILSSGYVKDSCTTVGSYVKPYTHPTLVKTDSLGNIVIKRYFDLNYGCNNHLGGSVIASDGSIVAWGYKADFLMMKVDSNLVPIWSRRFIQEGGVQFMKALPGGDLLAGINLANGGATVARLDPDGNFRWCKSYFRPRGTAHDAIIESDSSFVIIGHTDSTASGNIFEPLPPTFQPKQYMMKLDGEGTVQWCRGYDSAPNYWYTRQASVIKPTADGNYVMLATMGLPSSVFYDRNMLIKTDTNGDTLWTRSMGQSNRRYNGMGMLVASDGGILISGVAYGNNLPGMSNEIAFISKTDSVGLFACQNRNHPIEVLELFPTDSAVTLTSVDGWVAYGDPILYDTAFAQVPVYEVCKPSTGMPAAARASHGFRVKPNPTPGRITVSFPDPLERDTYYSVIDATGRLLYQRPLPAGGTEEDIDLSRFGRGTYILRITDPDGQRNERVVVE